MLDAAVTVGRRPLALRGPAGGRTAGSTSPDTATIARGEGDKAPLEMTKWFDSNYHYLVPEIGPETTFALGSIALGRRVRRGARRPGFLTRPVITGPVTFLLLAKPSDEALPEVPAAVPARSTCFPCMRSCSRPSRRRAPSGCRSTSPPSSRTSTSRARTSSRRAKTAYDALGDVTARPAILVAAPYASLDDALPVLASTAVEAIALDLVRGAVPDRASTSPARPSSPASSTATTSGAPTSTRRSRRRRRARPSAPR